MIYRVLLGYEPRAIWMVLVWMCLCLGSAQSYLYGPFSPHFHEIASVMLSRAFDRFVFEFQSLSRGYWKLTDVFVWLCAFSVDEFQYGDKGGEISVREVSRQIVCESCLEC